MREIVKQLQISGPFNIQFLVGGRTSGSKDEDELDGSFASMNDVRVIECNLRASRSVPFVSKATGVDFADVATRVLAGLPLPDEEKLPQLFPREGQAPQNFVAVKAPMFSFARLRGADPALGVEMSSTGEVACFGRDKEEAFLKALLSTTMKVPTAGSGDTVLVSFAAPLAHRALGPAFQLHDLGYDLVGTEATASYLRGRGVPCKTVAFPTDDSMVEDATATALLRDKKIKLAVNLHAPESKRLEDNYMIRRTAADFGIALVTNPQVFELLAAALTRHKKGDILAANPSTSSPTTSATGRRRADGRDRSGQCSTSAPALERNPPVRSPTRATPNHKKTTSPSRSRSLMLRSVSRGHGSCVAVQLNRVAPKIQSVNSGGGGA